MSLSIRHSFAAKLNLYILSSLTIIFFIGMGFFYRISTHYIEKQIYQNISRQADDINLRVSHLMRMVEKIPENVSWLLPGYVTVPDSIFNITRQIVKNNDEIFGCAIAFEPYYFPSKGKYFAPYSYMKGDSVITIQIDSNYNYYQRNWYKLAKENNISRWTRPYHELSSHEVITSTYSVPLRVILHNKLYFAIGDVSGKGIPASLLMASTISLLRTFSSHYSSPAQIACSLNNSIQERNENDMFVTFFIGMLDLDTGKLRYCNAGHTPPIMTHPDRTVSIFDIRPDLPLGILKDHIYQEYTYQFVAGSGILLYTDGVTDAENPAHEFYTKERLLRAVRQNHESHPREFIENILIDIQNHKKSQELTDDLSMLTVIYGTEWNIRKR